jgi:hypothetical protein
MKAKTAFAASLVVVVAALGAPGATFGQGLTPGEAIEQWGAAWQETDEKLRMQIIERMFAEDGIYTDPMSEVKGREALSAHIAASQAQPSENRLTMASAVDSHHGVRLRFAWELKSPDGKVIMEGMDYGELDEDGRIRLIVGFFGPFPPIESP